MLRRLVLVSIALVAVAPCSAASTPYASTGPLRLPTATPVSAVVPRYGRLELRLKLSATYDNPFDPDQIDVHCVFTSPTGRSYTVNGFLYQPFRRSLVGSNERVEPAGEPEWRVRFAPSEAGVWRYRVTARDRSGSVSLPIARFRATASPDPGYVRRSRRNPLAFAFEGEKPFCAVGENMCWGGSRGSFDYDVWLPALAKSGGNWIRIWMSSWNCGLEWSRENHGEWRSGGYQGVGVYSLDNAWKLDTILDIARRNRVYVMLCFGTYGEFTQGGFFNEGQWGANPYNVANGGPCAKSADFWTNAEARKLYRQRLRYLMARYADLPTIHSWEFWNETNAPAAWVGEMARAIRGTGEFRGCALDPYRHMITTTYGDANVWRIPDVDFTQTHTYGTGDRPDFGPEIAQNASEHEPFGKPHLMSEFGIDFRSSDAEYDPDGKAVSLHNGLWSSLTSGNAGTAMLWYWDNYVHPKNVYGEFAAARRFADKVPWVAARSVPLDIDQPHLVGVPGAWSDVVLPGRSLWEKATVTRATVTERGLEKGKVAPGFLFGPAKQDMRTAMTFDVNCRRPSRFSVEVSEVSSSAKLRITVDGRVALEKALSADPPSTPGEKPEYVKTVLRKEYNSYQATFDRSYGVDLDAGPHTITVENVDGDWLSVGTYTLGGYRRGVLARLNVFGRRIGTTSVLWIQNAAHNWKAVRNKVDIQPVDVSWTVIRGLPDGRYAVEWWDTSKGVRSSCVYGRSVGGQMKVTIPAIATDVAARIFPVGSDRSSGRARAGKGTR